MANLSLVAAARRFNLAVGDLRSLEEIGLLDISVDEHGNEFLTEEALRNLIRAMHDGTCPKFE